MGEITEGNRTGKRRGMRGGNWKGYLGGHRRGNEGGLLPHAAIEEVMGKVHLLDSVIDTTSTTNLLPNATTTEEGQ